MKLNHDEIQQRMADRGWTQGELARRYDCTQPAICRIMRRIKLGHDVNTATAHKIAKALGVNVRRVVLRNQESQ